MRDIVNDLNHEIKQQLHSEKEARTVEFQRFKHEQNASQKKLM